MTTCLGLYATKKHFDYVKRIQDFDPRPGVDETIRQVGAVVFTSEEIAHGRDLLPLHLQNSNSSNHFPLRAFLAEPARYKLVPEFLRPIISQKLIERFTAAE